MSFLEHVLFSYRYNFGFQAVLSKEHKSILVPCTVVKLASKNKQGSMKSAAYSKLKQFKATITWKKSSLTKSANWW